MQATSIDQLFDLETSIETAVKSILTDAGFSAHVQRDTSIDITPRIEIQFTPGGVYDAHVHMDAQGNKMYDAWNGTLSLGIFTNRAKNDSSHPVMRSKVRAFFNYAQGKFSEAVLPYHDVALLKEMATAPTVINDDNCDESAIHFSLVFSVRQNAWPNTQS